MKDYKLDPIHNSPWTVNWQDEDSEKLKNFIESSTGEKLIEILRAEIAGLNGHDKSYCYGYTVGVENMVAKIRQMPYAPIEQYRPMTQVDAEEERAKNDPDNISYPSITSETD